MKQLKTYQKSQVLQKSEKTILLYKQLGQTPLEAIQALDIKEKVGYAGRLDPMAEGLLLLLVGEENKKKVSYEGLTKEYRFECLVGLETDSLDVLGLVTNVYSGSQISISRSALERALSGFEGSGDLPYPIYSSKRVQGKPLFYWARANKLSEIEIPSKKVHISRLELNSTQVMAGKEIALDAIEKVHMVRGDFRQKAIIERWREFQIKHGEKDFIVADMTAQVSSGTYIRSLCREIGRSFGTCGMAQSIRRTRVGEYHLNPEK